MHPLRNFPLLITALVAAGILHARPLTGYDTSSDVDQLRLELDDVKHALHSTQVECSLLDERLRKQDSALKGIKGENQTKEASSLSLLSAQILSLEKKVFNFENTLTKAAGDLRTLNSLLAQALAKIQTLEANLSQHDKRLDEVSKLKGTLTSISKAIGQRPSSEASHAVKRLYRVKAGDSLEKIARSHRVSVDSIRKINNLLEDKIVIGQELRIPDDAS
jgi:LysM repeat protein